jgi:hypothetical protein
LLRKVVCLLGLLFCAYGMTSSLWFYDTFVWNHNTTSYVPLLWGTNITNPGTVLNLTYYWMLLSLTVGLVSAYGMGKEDSKPLKREGEKRIWVFHGRPKPQPSRNRSATKSSAQNVSVKPRCRLSPMAADRASSRPAVQSRKHSARPGKEWTVKIAINTKQAIAIVWTLVAIPLALIVTLATGLPNSIIGNSASTSPAPWWAMIAVFFGFLFLITLPVYLVDSLVVVSD